ncbi:MAG TPA: cytochrome c oxidase subunit 3 [Saprospiraceae bacterium]|nr:cytochrome c oxidase subunit 3 [Saprospiraceae bacterium]
MAEGVLKIQFDDLAQQREAGTLGMWAFLSTELLLFSGLFLGYLVYRYNYPETFVEAGRHTHLVLGGINTAVLLTSSLTVALATLAVKAKWRSALVVLLSITMLLGLAFIGIKGFEYYKEFQEQLAPFPGLTFHFEGQHPEQAKIFYSLYFIMTGLHALHLSVAIIIMAVMTVLTLRHHQWEKLEAKIDISGLYWHFVDIVWVFIFPIIYLLGRS